MIAAVVLLAVALVGVMLWCYRLSKQAESASAEVVEQDASLKSLRSKRELEQEASARLERALDETRQGVIVVDTDGEIVFANEVASPFIGGRHGEAIVEKRVAAGLDELEASDSFGGEIELFGPPRRTLVLNGLALTGSSGDPLGAVVLIDDVTDQRRLTAIRRDFVANIGHELRTPVGAISLLAETIDGESDPLVVRQLSDRLAGEVQRLGQTVDDLLEFSRIEHDERGERELISLQAVLAEATDRHQVAAANRGIEVDLTTPAAAVDIWANRRQLVSAISNLVDNSIKYTGPDGQVNVRAWSDDDSARIEVSDTGVGIPNRDLERVFERFYRVDGSRQRADASDGVGIGLALVRHVASNHGGAVSVSSNEGEGSTFLITLPLGVEATDEARSSEKELR